MNAKKRIGPDTIYIGDNGRTYCGEHGGTSAIYTLRDISGQRVLIVTPTVLAESRAAGYADPECERCGKGASALYEVQS